MRRPSPPRRVRSFPHVEGDFATAVFIKREFWRVRAKGGGGREGSSARTGGLKKRKRQSPLANQHIDPTLFTALPTTTCGWRPPVPQHAGVRAALLRLLDALQAPAAAAGLPRFHAIDALAPPKRAGGRGDGAQPQQSAPHTAAAAASGGSGSPPPPPVPPHISLSRTVSVRLEQAAPLLASLSRRLRASGARARTLALRGLAAFANDERTRTFAALRVRDGADDVLRLIAAVDAAFQEHGLRTFYEVGEKGARPRRC